MKTNLKSIELIILISLIFAIVGLLLGSGLLFWVTKLFKIENPSYKKSLIILTISGIASFITGFIFNIINLGFLSAILGSITVFLIFHYLYKKYYHNSWKKSLGIYLTMGISGFVLSLMLIMPIRIYVFSPFVVSGQAMSPTYNNGDYLLVNKIDTSFDRSDVVIFRLPEDPRQIYIKKIIGLPSEKVDIQGGKVFINGQVLNESYYTGETSPNGSITLSRNQYFVLGDNRNESADSRLWGPITKSDIEGKIFYELSNSIK